MKKNYSILASIFLLTFISCSSTQRIFIDDKKSVNTEEFESFHITTKSDDEDYLLFIEALNCCINKNWDNAIEKIKQAALKNPDNGKSKYIPFLFLMVNRSFPSDKVIDVIKQLDNVLFQDNFLYFSLIKDNPMKLQWLSDSFETKWISPYIASVSKILGYQTTNWPVVIVKINDVPLRMILDTGADRTVISENAARKTGLSTLQDYKIIVEDAAGKKSYYNTALIHSLQIGDLIVQNTDCCISDSKTSINVVDGVIGWPILSQLVVSFDAKKRTITFTKPTEVITQKTNFYWVQKPIISCGTITNQIKQSFFMLDTGATKTKFSELGIEQFGVSKIFSGFRLSGAANGAYIRKSSKFSKITLVIDSKIICFMNHYNVFPGTWLLPLSGNIGSDIMQAGILTLNYPAGTYKFEKYK